jgi:alpha/beta superfamily hydrolase
MLLYDSPFSFTGSAEVAHLADLCSKEPSVILIGYSHGSLINLKVAANLQNVKAIVSISYPYSVMSLLTLFHHWRYMDALAQLPAVPKLFITGSNDNFTSLSAFESFYQLIPQPKELLVVQGQDHFWSDPSQLLDRVYEFVSKC